MKKPEVKTPSLSETQSKGTKKYSEITEFYQIIGLALFIDLLILIICKAR